MQCILGRLVYQEMREEERTRESEREREVGLLQPLCLQVTRLGSKGIELYLLHARDIYRSQAEEGRAFY